MKQMCSTMCSKMKIDRRLIRFFLVGCVNSLVGFLVMLTSYYVLFMGYWLSSALNYLISSICSYFLNRKFTFGCQERNWQLPLKFTLNIIVCYTIAYSIAQPLIAWLCGAHNPAFGDFLSMMTGMILFSLLNFFGQSIFVFGKPRQQTKLKNVPFLSAL